jgi:GTPase
MPGDMKYIKTILFGVNSVSMISNNIIICIPVFTINNVPIINNESNEEKKGYNIVEFIRQNKDIYKFIIQMCGSLNVNPIIVATKSDQLDKSTNRDSIIKDIKSELDKLISEDDNKAFNNIIDTSSIIFVSNVTEEGYTELINKLSKIKSQLSQSEKNYESNIRGKLFVVNDMFRIPDRGQIYHGHLLNGVINVDDDVEIFCHGTIQKKKIKSIHRKSVDVERLLPGESGSITFYGKPEKNIDKTMMIIETKHNRQVTEMKCELIFKSKEKIKQQQYTLFTGNTIVNVNCTNIDNNTYNFKSVNNVPIIIISRIGIIKDNINNYFFIKFI